MKKLTILALCALVLLSLLLGACSPKPAVSSKSGTKTEGDASEERADSQKTEPSYGSRQELESAIQAIYDKEDAILEKDAKLWEKLESFIPKQMSDEYVNMSYDEFLSIGLEKGGKEFSDEERAILEEGIKQIKEFQAEVLPLEKIWKEKYGEEAAAEENRMLEENAANAEKISGKAFPAMEGTDLDGNSVDSSIFSKNTFTVLNFWFSGCAPCVGELAELDALNKKYAEKCGAVVGFNTETMDGDEDGIATAKSILEKKGASYLNVCLKSDSEAGKYAMSLMAFPTTLVVDKNGNVVGEPILGALTEDANMAKLQALVDEAVKAAK